MSDVVGGGDCRIRVLVLDRSDRPVEDAVVFIEESAQGHSDIAAVTDRRGLVEFRDLDAGPHRIRARLEALEPTADIVEASGIVDASEASSTTVTLRLGA